MLSGVITPSHFSSASSSSVTRWNSDDSATNFRARMILPSVQRRKLQCRKTRYHHVNIEDAKYAGEGKEKNGKDKRKMAGQHQGGLGII